MMVRKERQIFHTCSCLSILCCLKTQLYIKLSPFSFLMDPYSFPFNEPQMLFRGCLILKNTDQLGACQALVGMAVPASYKCLWPFKGLNRTSLKHASCHGHRCTHLQGKLEALLITSKTTWGDKESMFASELATGCLLASPPTRFHRTKSHSTAEVKVCSSHLSKWSRGVCVCVNTKPSLADFSSSGEGWVTYSGDCKSDGGKSYEGWSKATRTHFFKELFMCVCICLCAFMCTTGMQVALEAR